MGSWGGEDSRHGSGWCTGWVSQWQAERVVPHLHVDKLGETTGE